MDKDSSNGKTSWERTIAAEEEIARRIGNAPTLRQLVGHFAFAETPEDLDATKNVAILPEQRSYVALRVRGFSSLAASRQLNLNTNAAQRWETESWFEVIAEEERRRWLQGAGIDQKQEALIPLVPDTIAAIKETLHSEDEKIKLSAAQFVLDNVFGEARKPVGRPATPRNENNTSPDLTDIMASAIQRINEARETSAGNIVGIISSSDYASPNGIADSK